MSCFNYILLTFTYFCIAFSIESHAIDLGNVGTIYPIKEENLINVAKARVQKRIDNGEWNKEVEKWKKRTRKYVERPDPVILPKATQYSVHYYNPAIVLQNDILDQYGQVLFKKGTQVNPLDYISLSRPIIFFNADDKAQKVWAKNIWLMQPSVRIILTQGAIMQLMKEWQKRVYFDQHGIYTSKLNITALPALITQENKVLKVEQIALNARGEVIKQ